MSTPIGESDADNIANACSRSGSKALLSVYDKSDLLEFAKGLSEAGVRLLGSGGTAKKIRDAGISIE
jgi:AICAR transformylase/IMP cyclohydrolase PurH